MTEPLEKLEKHAIEGPALLADAAGASGAWGLLPYLAGFLVGVAIVLAISARIRPLHLALGFATTAAMWAIGYVSMMAPGLWVGELLFLLTLAVPVAGGAVARRGGASPVKVGLVSAFANLLVIGMFLRGGGGEGSTVEAGLVASLFEPLLYVGGLFAASAGLAALGGVLARRARPIELPAPTALFAAVAAATVFILLVTGGLVTGLESGLAVPDWPNSFGHNMLLYPISEMKGGIYYEHAHRLFGMLVGTTALVFVTVVFREEKQGALRALACLFLGLVCVQGLFGGLRVTGTLTVAQSGTELTPSTLLAIVHGMLGQVVLALACVIACVASATWRNAGRSPAAAFVGLPEASRLRALPVALVAAMLVQLFLGASYRHLQIPPGDGRAAVHPAWPIWGHVAGAFLVLGLSVAAGALASSRLRTFAPTRILGKALIHGVGLQFALGIAALVVVLIRTDARIPAYEVATTSVHQSLGALLLASAAMLAVWSRRVVAAPAASEAPTPVTRSQPMA